MPRPTVPRARCRNARRSTAHARSRRTTVPGKRIVNVFTFEATRTAIAVTRLESTPPLSRMPTGTSATSWRRTQSCSSASSSSSSRSSSTGPSTSSGSSRSRHLRRLPSSSRYTNALAGGSLLTPWMMQSRPGRNPSTDNSRVQPDRPAAAWPCQPSAPSAPRQSAADHRSPYRKVAFRPRGPGRGTDDCAGCRTDRTRTCRSGGPGRRRPTAGRRPGSPGVAVRPKCMTKSLQFGAQVEVVVDLTVEHDRQLAQRITHRLMPAGGQVDDRQPAMSEPDPAVGSVPVARVVQPRCRVVLDQSAASGCRPRSARRRIRLFHT